MHSWNLRYAQIYVGKNEIEVGGWRAQLSIRCPQQLQQRQEQVDDVEVEWNCSPYVLIVRVALDDIVCVIDDVATEDKWRQSTIYHHRDLAQWEKDLRGKISISIMCKSA